MAVETEKTIDLRQYVGLTRMQSEAALTGQVHLSRLLPAILPHRLKSYDAHSQMPSPFYHTFFILRGTCFRQESSL